MHIAIEGTVAIKRLGGISEYARQVISHLGQIDHHNRYTVATAALFRSKTHALPHLPSSMHEKRILMPARMLESMWYSRGWPPFEWFSGKADVLFFPRPLAIPSSTPSVAAVHDLSWLIMPEVALEADKQLFEKALRRTVLCAERIVAISEATKHDLVQHLDVDPQKIMVTYLGYDETLVKPVSEDVIQHFRGDYRIGQDPYFLHVGTLEPRKNLVRLVRAFDRYKKSSHNAHKLVLVGRSGWLYDELLQAIAASSYRDDIILTGPVSEIERRAAYWGALAVAFPSLYEGFGLPILEAQATQRPVLTGTGGSLREIGADSVLAVDVQDENALARGLQQLAEDPIFCQQLVTKGLRNLQRFSWARCARETLAVLEDAGRV